MTAREHETLVDQILNPAAGNADGLLSGLGLASFPSRDEVHRQIEEHLLLPNSTLPDHWLPTYQIHWETKLSIPSLLKFEPSPPPTSLAFVRTGLQGRVTGYNEVSNPRVSTGLTSSALDRAPGPSRNFVRGKSGYVPFLPGGLDSLKPVDDVIDFQEGSSRLRTVAPGLSRGLRLPGQPAEDFDSDLVGLTAGRRAAPEEHEALTGQTYSSLEEEDAPLGNGTADIDELLPTSRSHLNPVASARRQLRRVNVQKRDWAHEVDVNKEMTNFHELVPEMAHEYPFELDTFQKEAVYHLEMGDSVFVAAHTSAGKTVVAEYAIALAAKHMTRAIYTSPIKALSNQKYRDFKQTFGAASVGILTGDVQINPEANCLIMTTEILRSMLYKGADLIRDVEFVIFDEVHYVNDAERGVVWEEVIIMLPDHVNIILLSATVPNTKEFADWVGRTKKKDIYVISTSKRPVPLEHYLYAGRDLHKIVDADRRYLGQGYKDAGEALRRKQDKEREAQGLPPVQKLGARAAAPQRGQRGGPPSRGGQRGGTPARGAPARGAPARGGGSSRTFHQPDKNLYVHLIGNLRKRGLLPVVVFTFSKKRCEENAGTLTNLDLSTSVERSEIHVAIEKALSRLKGSDRQLPQIRRMRDLLSRGIGVHHGGLLPIVKEVVEILFARGLVKVLFATETFAMGVNMPAKCVVFSHIRKHDGRSFRDLNPGEYTQMAGRAGRRGLDSTGTVIIVANDECPEQTTLQNMILGTPTKLQSQFRLTYNMILNLLRVEALRVEEMIKRSFSENATQRIMPENQKKVVETERKLSSLPKLECDVCAPDLERLYDVSFDIVQLNHQILTKAVNKGGRYLTPGRIVILRDGHFKWSMAAFLKPVPSTVKARDSHDEEKVKLYYVLALVSPETKAKKHDVDAEAVPPRWPPTPESLLIDEPTYELTAVPATSIAMVTYDCIKVDVPLLVEKHKLSALKGTVKPLQEVLNGWLQQGSIPEADWGRNRQLEFQELLRQRQQLVRQLDGIACTSCPDLEDHYMFMHGKKVLQANIEALKMSLSDENLALIPDYEQRIAVLKELKFIDDNSTVLLKGRVACEINSANELVLTELILENTLAAYEPEEVVALLSCFVFQEKTDVEPVIPPKLQEGLAAVMAIAERVEAVQTRNNALAEDFRALKPGLVEVVYEWAKGMPFEQITELTDVAEGTIVRVITRLDETCREVRDAARVIGDAELFKKMEEAQIKIKRDIVFAASLYF
ncbi:antiviral helicase [Polyporus arcularius HHB13444]|uniref:Antiviral helicase n=1 Tax=Polyporus arcularius HHB13444 TaxID=1314778 RepID=A0A5C3Q1R3_9APHY|nr:antiviral helicase [Polyporus arcularius HHB13444]